MNKKYSGLNTLIQDNMEAKKYYNALPDYVREQIASRSSGVNSYNSLRDYAENLLRGDE